MNLFTFPTTLSQYQNHKVLSPLQGVRLNIQVALWPFAYLPLYLYINYFMKIHHAVMHNKIVRKLNKSLHQWTYIEDDAWCNQLYIQKVQVNDWDKTYATLGQTWMVKFWCVLVCKKNNCTRRTKKTIAPAGLWARTNQIRVMMAREFGRRLEQQSISINKHAEKTVVCAMADLFSDSKLRCCKTKPPSKRFWKQQGCNNRWNTQQ